MNVLGQRMSVSSDRLMESHVVNTYLDKYTVYDVGVSSMYEEILSTRNEVFSLDFLEELGWDFNLEPVSIITDDTKVFEVGEQGKSLYRQPIKVKTYHGTFRDGRSGSLRLTISDSYLYGMVIDEEETYYFEPIRNYDGTSVTTKIVLYNERDVSKANASYTCNHDDEPLRTDVEENIIESRFNGICYKAKIAVLADYAMYIDPAHAGIEALINHLVGVINNVQSNYEFNGNTNFSNGVNFEFSEIIVSTCANCDYLTATTSPAQLLSEFTGWINEGGFSDPFHAAHFWTNRDLVGFTIGLAYQSPNLYCNSQAQAVLEDWTNTAALLRVMVGHEMAHNFNGVHDGSSNFMLSPTVTVTNIWSPASKSTINVQISNQGPSCMTSCVPAPCGIVGNLTLVSVTNAGISVSWDSNSNSLYTVRVRNYGEDNFIQDITTINNSIILTPPGYAICKRYEVFIYNNCGASGLSASQRLVITSPTAQGCADFEVQKKLGYTGEAISFTDKSENATSWLWDFGNGQTSTLQNPTIIYNVMGVYDISLTVNNGHTMVRNDFIKILPDLNVPFLNNQGGNFESNPNIFGSELISGTVDLWERGTSNYVLVTNGNAWKTRLNSDIPRVNSRSGLYSPRFNLTSHANHVLHFDIGMETQFCNGPFGVQVQYSTNNGSSWTRLGSSSNYYNIGPSQACSFARQVFADSTGWAFNTNYLHKEIDISFLNTQPQVIFRIVASVSSVFSNGYAIDGALIDNFQIFSNNSMLAIEKNSLRGYITKDVSKLAWTVNSSDDVAKFEILRSRDGLDFVTIGIVDALNAINTSSYYFTDNIPLAGSNFYQVKAINTDLSADFTNVVRLDYSTASNYQIFPNPILGDGFVNIVSSKNQNIKEIMLIDALGKVVASSLAIDKHYTRLDVSHLMPGVYVATITSEFLTTENIKVMVAY